MKWIFLVFIVISLLWSNGGSTLLQAASDVSVLVGKENEGSYQFAEELARLCPEIDWGDTMCSCLSLHD